MSNFAKNQAQSLLEGAVSGKEATAEKIAGTWEQSQAKYFSKLLWPSIILLTTITILPVIFLIVTSFTSWDLSRPGSLVFTGLKNYVRIFSKDPRFWNSVTVQIKLSLMTVPAQIVIGLGLAVFVHEKIKHSFLIEMARGVLPVGCTFLM